MLYNVIVLYLLLINAAGFLLMLVDKLKAKRNLWRIPEATLICVAIAFGSIGILGGMYAFRHKTLHGKFKLGVPIILTLQIVGIVCIASAIH